MGEHLRREVLQVFKRLHRTRLKKFEGDPHALDVVRKRINDEYRKYKDVTNEAAIIELNKFATEVEQEVRTTVIQVREKKPGLYEALITPDTATVDNVPYKESNEESSHQSSKRKSEQPKKVDKKE